MAFRSLGDFLADLDSRNDLLRIREPVSRDLEITEITQRVIRKDGPALLFENVTGSSIPVVMNALGSPRRIARALGAETLDGPVDRIARLTRLRPPAGVMGALKDLSGTLQTLDTLRSLAPKRVSAAPCQEVETDQVDLDALPILRCWPGDGGRTITFPVVVTKDPELSLIHI